jgi:hypothetical protein
MAYKYSKTQMDSIKKEDEIKKRMNRKYYKESLQMLLFGLTLLVIAIFWGLAGIKYNWWRIFCLPAILPLYFGLWLTFDSIKKIIFRGHKKTLVSGIKNNRDIVKGKSNYLDRVKIWKEKYGPITKEIIYNNIYYTGCYIGKNKIRDTIYVFESSSIIIINSIPYSFMDILSFNILESPSKTAINQIITTKTSTKSVIGRTVVGGLLLGGVGAIIGGTTAKKKTIIPGQNIKINCDYVVIITVNSLSSRNIKLEIGDKVEIVQEISSILSIICERNKHNINKANT